MNVSWESLILARSAWLAWYGGVRYTARRMGCALRATGGYGGSHRTRNTGLCRVGAVLASRTRSAGRTAERMQHIRFRAADTSCTLCGRSMSPDQPHTLHVALSRATAGNRACPHAVHADVDWHVLTRYTPRSSQHPQTPTCPHRASRAHQHATAPHGPGTAPPHSSHTPRRRCTGPSRHTGIAGSRPRLPTCRSPPCTCCTLMSTQSCTAPRARCAATAPSSPTASVTEPAAHGAHAKPWSFTDPLHMQFIAPTQPACSTSHWCTLSRSAGRTALVLPRRACHACHWLRAVLPRHTPCKCFHHTQCVCHKAARHTWHGDVDTEA